MIDEKKKEELYYLFEDMIQANVMFMEEKAAAQKTKEVSERIKEIFGFDILSYRREKISKQSIENKDYLVDIIYELESIKARLMAINEKDTLTSLKILKKVSILSSIILDLKILRGASGE